MTNPLHKQAPVAERHSALSKGPFTSTTLRRAESGYDPTLDLGAQAFQTDTDPPTLWYVSKIVSGVPTWRQVTTAADNTLSAPGTILGSELAWWIDGVSSTIVDAGGGIASSASDASGNGYAATFASSHQPSIIASGLNGKKTLRFTSSQYGGNTAFAAAAPGTTPIYTFMVVKSATAASNSVFLGTGSENIYVGTGTKVNDFNGAAGAQSSVLTAATWYIVEVLRSNQSTDYAQLGGVTGVAGNAGNTANTGWMLNATSAGAQGNDCEFATVFQWLGTPTGTQRTNLRAWANGIWGV